MGSIALQQQVVSKRVPSDEVDALRGMDAVKWIQGQAFAKGKSYTDVEKLAASAHVWASYYQRFGEPSMRECLAAAKMLLGGGR